MSEILACLVGRLHFMYRTWGPRLRLRSPLLVSLGSHNGRELTWPRPGLHHNLHERRTPLRTIYALLVAVILLSLDHFAIPSAMSQQSPTEFTSGSSRFVGSWWRHGMSLTVQSHGLGELRWRTYNNDCRLTANEACDWLAPGEIVSGGYAIIGFTRVSGATALGQVFATTDAATAPLGSVSLSLMQGGLAELGLSGSTIVLCTTDYRDDPRDAGLPSPCGA